MLRRKKNAEKQGADKNKTTLASVLLSMKAVTKEQLEDASAKKAEHDDMLLASTLRSLGYCTSEDVSKALGIQSKMLQGDQANVALDLMEARLERFRAKEEEIREELSKKQSSSVVIALSPASVKHA